MTQKSFIEKELELKKSGVWILAEEVEEVIQSALKEFKRRIENERDKLGKLEQLTYARIYEIAEGVFGRIE